MANVDKRCMGCMNPLPDGRQECGVCGYPAGGINPDGYLQVRTLLSGRYLAGRVLEAGGDSALYIGYDQVQEAPVFIREFYPETLCGRGEDGRIALLAGCEATFEEMAEKFRSHARVLARLRDLPAVVPLYDIFDENGTVYTVSEKIGGVTLAEQLRRTGGRMDWEEEARPLFMPLLSALASIHSTGIYHLGLCPDNILLCSDGRLRLTNFLLPEARMAGTDLKPQILVGYAAPEQYEIDGGCTAATDVYGIAATIFAALTGNPPADGAARARENADLLMPADVARELPAHVKTALFHALQVSPDKRIQTIAQLRDRLSAAPAVTALLREEPTPPKKAEPEPVKEEKPRKHSRLKIGLLIFLAVFIVLLLFAFGVLLLLFPDAFHFGGTEASSLPPSTSTYISPSSASPDSQLPAEDPLSYFAVADVRGQNYYDIKGTKLNGDMPIEVAGKQYSDQPKGTILSQEPAPEERAKKGTTVKVILSDGPQQRTVPDVSGWPEQYAKLYLEALGYQVETIYLEVSSVDKGLVQETSPLQGSTAEEGDTIILRVSNQDQTPPTVSSDGGGWFW